MASAKTLRTIVAGFIVFLFFYLAVIPTGSSKKKKVIEEHPTQEETEVKAKKKVCPEEMYTMDDVKKHMACSLRDTKNNDLWLVIDDKVYDVTPWIVRHPGGDRICDGAGRDASQLFANNHHSGVAREEELPNYCIGHLKKDFTY